MAFATGEHAEEDGSGLPSLGAVDEEPVAASQGDATQRPLGGIVVCAL